jgi:hypothetical protein
VGGKEIGRVGSECAGAVGRGCNLHMGRGNMTDESETWGRSSGDYGLVGGFG